MLPTTNHTIAILRYSRTDGLGSFASVQTGIRVYINSIREDLVESLDAAGSFRGFRMMTNGNHEEIEIGDNITDEDGNTYSITGKAISKDITGIHHQYLMVQKYD